MVAGLGVPILRVFTVNLSYKMDLDFQNYFRRKKPLPCN